MRPLSWAECFFIVGAIAMTGGLSVMIWQRPTAAAG